MCVWTDTVDTKKPLHKSKGCEVVAQRHSCHVCVATSVCTITIVPNNNNKINNNSKTFPPWPPIVIEDILSLNEFESVHGNAFNAFDVLKVWFVELAKLASVSICNNKTSANSLREVQGMFLCKRLKQFKRLCAFKKLRGNVSIFFSILENCFERWLIFKRENFYEFVTFLFLNFTHDCKAAINMLIALGGTNKKLQHFFKKKNDRVCLHFLQHC